MTPHVNITVAHSLVEYAIVSTKPARRLVVFVHGWGGSPHRSWGEFDRPPGDGWWSEADLIFVKYKSVRESVSASADRFRALISDFYPVPSALLVKRDDVLIREDSQKPYEELILVGHSLGGLLLRRALIDAADEWRHCYYAIDKRPVLMDGALRLFSPASAGFQPRGLLGAARELPLWWVAEAALTNGSYADLQMDSPVIHSTRKRTERFETRKGKTASLAASILWANPERVVATERYQTDLRSGTLDFTNHLSICKPRPGYPVPYEFVRTGVADVSS
jgi:pimeloyl-ACP methyl ester carboxylesterase